MLKGIIFDFDGVIAESVQIKTNAFVELYSNYGTDIVRKVVKHHEANGGMSRYKKIKLYHKTLLDIVLTEKKLKELTDRFSRFVVDKVIEAPYVPGVMQFINENYNKYKLFISTGTPIDEINLILKKRDMIHYFDNVYGSPDTKKLHILKIIEDYNLKNHELIFIGDSKTDADAANHFNLQFILRKHKYNNNNFDIDDYIIIEDFNNMILFNS